MLGVRPEHIALRRRVAAPRRGLRRRVSRHDADRHGQHRARPVKARTAGQPARSRPASTSASRFHAERLSLFDAASGRAIRTAPCTRRGGRMAEVALEGVTKRFGDVARRRRISSLDDRRRRVRRAARARPAPARPRRCACRRARDSRTQGRISSAAATSTALPPAARDVAFVFQQYSLYPHLSRLRQSRLPAALAGAPHARGRDHGAGRARSRELLRIDDKLAEPRDAALRRRDAARRDRPRAGAPARRSI